MKFIDEDPGVGTIESTKYVHNTNALAGVPENDQQYLTTDTADFWFEKVAVPWISDV